MTAEMLFYFWKRPKKGFIGLLSTWKEITAVIEKKTF